MNTFLMKELQGMSRGDWLACAAIALFISACGVIGYSYAYGMGWAYFSWAQMISLSILITFPVMALLILINLGVGRLARARIAGEPRRSFLERITPRWQKRSVILFALIMLVLWTPWLLAMVPGGMNNDTFYQIYQVYPEHHPVRLIPFFGVDNNVELDAWLVDHHPVLTTLIFGAFGYASDVLTGDWLCGVIAYCIIQSIVYALLYTASVAYLRRVHCPLALVLALYLFYCIMPFIPSWAFCMIKDSVFGLFVIPYFMMLFEAFRTRGAFLHKRSHVVWFVCIALLVCLTRKQGIFIVAPTAFVALLVFALSVKEKEAARAFLIQLVSSVLMMALVLPLIIFPLANIHAGGRQEVLGVLFQQTARYLVDNPDDVTEEERAAIAGVIDVEELASKYEFDSQDHVKWLVNNQMTSEQIADYLRAYVSMGLRHPGSYFAAVLGIAGYYFAPTTYIFWPGHKPYFEHEDHVYLPSTDFLFDYSLWMNRNYIKVAQIYGLNTPLLMVVYCLWIPAAMLFVIMRRRLRCKTLILPFAIILVTFFVVAPVYDSRYIVVSFEIAPLLFGYIVAIMRRQIIDEGSTHHAEEPERTEGIMEVQT